MGAWCSPRHLYCFPSPAYLGAFPQVLEAFPQVLDQGHWGTFVVILDTPVHPSCAEGGYASYTDVVVSVGGAHRHYWAHLADQVAQVFAPGLLYFLAYSDLRRASFQGRQAHDSCPALPSSDAQKEDTRMADWEHDCCAATDVEDTVGREA